MMNTRRIQIDRISSVTRNAKLQRMVSIGNEIPANQGVIVAAKVLNNKYTYNTIENFAGRMIRLRSGDVIAGALGSRRALKGYAGRVPGSVRSGDILHLLNLGGVIGECTAVNPELGDPFQVEILGTILSFPMLGDRVGIPATIENSAFETNEKLLNPPPIVYVAGTSMNSGKTLAATEILRVLTRRGYSVAACKLTGVSLMRDILSMSDAGATQVLDFTDAGVVSTEKEAILPVARGLVNQLSASQPDIIIAELGDGLLGDYGVSEILRDSELMKAASCFVVCAPDPVAIYGAKELFDSCFKLPIDVVAGPVTDNDVGVGFINDRLDLPAHNARYDIDKLVDIVEMKVKESGGGHD